MSQFLKVKNFNGSDNKVLHIQDEVHNNDLIELAKSGLIKGDIVSYNNDSFMFETEDIVMPSFILENPIEIKSLLGLDIDPSLFIGENRKKIKDIISMRFSGSQKRQEYVDLIKFKSIRDTLMAEGRESTAEQLASFTSRSFKDMFIFNIDLLTDASDKAYFSISIKPNISMGDILDDYIEAVLFLNKSYRIKLSYEKLSYCPIETKLGSQIVSVIDTINIMTSKAMDIVKNELLQIVEEVLTVNIEEYSVEDFSTSGIRAKMKDITYFKNVLSCSGSIAFIKNINTGNYLIGELREKFEYLPLEISSSNSDLIFSESYELRELVKDYLK